MDEPVRSRPRIRWLGVAVAALLISIAVAYSGRFPTNGVHYGWWSIVPPVVALVLAFALREVISALFIGIVLGGVISGRLNVVQEFLIPSIGSPGYGLILLVYLWALGGLVGMWTRTGGALEFANWAGAKMVKGPNTAKLFTWILGLIFHQGGSISTVLTGATARPVSDRHNVAHEELAYVVDSTGSPAATLIPFNVWPIYVGGLVAGTVPIIADGAAGRVFFFRAIPFNFYAIFAILFTLLFAFGRGPATWFGRMKAAMARSRETGELDRPGSEPLAAEELTRIDLPEGYRPSLIDFFGPMSVLLGVAIIPFIYTFGIQGRDDPLLPIAEAFVLAVLAAIGLALARGMPLRDAMDGFVNGCKGVTIGAIVLALAVTLKSVADAVGTAPYVVETVGSWIPPVALPASLLLIAMFVAFSTGTSWGTYAVLFPVAMPLAWAVLPDPMFLTLCFGAVTGGSVFGDQCSPISDTTILSSLVSGCDLMDHVLTQMPPALFAAALAALAYTLVALAVV